MAFVFSNMIKTRIGVLLGLGILLMAPLCHGQSILVLLDVTNSDFNSAVSDTWEGASLSHRSEWSLGFVADHYHKEDSPNQYGLLFGRSSVRNEPIGEHDCQYTHKMVSLQGLLGRRVGKWDIANITVGTSLGLGLLGHDSNSSLVNRCDTDWSTVLVVNFTLIVTPYVQLAVPVFAESELLLQVRRPTYSSNDDSLAPFKSGMMLSLGIALHKK